MTLTPKLTYIRWAGVTAVLQHLGHHNELRYAADTRMVLTTEDGTVVNEGADMIEIPDPCSGVRLETSSMTHTVGGGAGNDAHDEYAGRIVSGPIPARHYLSDIRR